MNWHCNPRFELKVQITFNVNWDFLLGIFLSSHSWWRMVNRTWFIRIVCGEMKCTSTLTSWQAPIPSIYVISFHGITHPQGPSPCEAVKAWKRCFKAGSRLLTPLLAQIEEIPNHNKVNQATSNQATSKQATRTQRHMVLLSFDACVSSSVWSFFCAS